MRILLALLFFIAAQAHATISLVSAATPGDAFTASGGVDTVNLSISQPSSAASGDMLYACVGGQVTTNGAPTLATPTGWTAVAKEYNSSGSTDHALGFFQCPFDTCSGSSYTFSMTRTSGTGALSLVAGVIAVRGANETLDVTYASGSHLAQTTNDDNPNQPDITTATNNAWVLACLGGTGTFTTAEGPPSGMTMLTSKLTNSGRQFELAYALRATAGAYSPGVWTHTGGAGTSEMQAMSFAIAPSTSGCGVSRSMVTIASTAAATDPTNILYGQGAGVGDDICYDSTSTTLSDTVSIDTSGYVTLNSGGDLRTDEFTYCIDDAGTDGAACGTDGTTQITSQPVLTVDTDPLVLSETTAELYVTLNQVEGTVYTCVQASAVATPSHAQIAAGNNGAGAACVFADSDTPADTTQEWSDAESANGSPKASGLTAGTSYEACFGQANAATTPLTATVICSDTFITTASGDSTPDAFSFNDLIEVALAQEYWSNEVTITGLDTTANVIVDTCEWRKYSSGVWGSWTSAIGTISNNEQLQVRFVGSSPEPFDGYSCIVSVGGVTDTWSVTTAFDPTLTAARDFSEWFYNQPGYTGAAPGRMKEFLADQGFTGPLNTALFNYLRARGYTGSLITMIDAFERDVTSQHGGN